MTPLQQASQELVDRIADLGASPLDWPEYTALEKALEAEQAQAANSRIGFLYEELRKAIDEGSESMTHDDALKQIAYWQDKEQAQAVEPVAWMYDWEPDEEVVTDWLTTDYDEAHSPTMGHRNIRPLYFHPATPPAGEHVPEAAFGNIERAELIHWLRERSMWDGMIRLIDAANMLESDVSLINEGNKAQQVAVPVPLTDEQIKEITSDNSLDTIHAVVRAIEAHHKIGAKK